MAGVCGRLDVSRVSWRRLWGLWLLVRDPCPRRTPAGARLADAVCEGNTDQLVKGTLESDTDRAASMQQLMRPQHGKTSLNSAMNHRMHISSTFPDALEPAQRPCLLRSAFPSCRSSRFRERIPAMIIRTARRGNCTEMCTCRVRCCDLHTP